MPKDRRLNFLSSDRARASPYACSSKDSNHDKWESSLPPVGDEKEWEEARCPICMEHPHNAVLLFCTSREKGCRPYMCDTSHRHSNCLDQFCKSVAGVLSTELQEDVTIARMQYPRGRVEQTLLRPNRATGGQVPKILCPLCRGQVSGWVVIENARCYMNSKVRSCSLESCNFTGNYVELRKHARCEHPTVRPSDVDPERQSEWVRLERETDLRDTLSVVQSQFGDGSYDYSPSDWTFDSGISDESENEDEWSEGAAMSVDFDFGVEFTFSLLSEFTFGPSDGARNSGSARTIARSLNGRSMTSRAYYRGGITSSRRRSATPSRLGSEGVRNSGSERTGGRSQNRRLTRSRSWSRSRSRSRSNDQVEFTFPRRWNRTPSRSAGSRNTGNEGTGGRSLGRRSMRLRSRSNPLAEVTPPRMARNPDGGISGRLFGSRSNPRAEVTPPRRTRNAGSERVSGRSSGGRSVASRSRLNHQGETASLRRSNASSSGSGSWRYAE